MQFQVPQFIEVEDKIFGPLTFKQFIYVGGALGGAYLAYRTLPIYASSPIVLVVCGLGVALAFLEYNGRPFIVSLESAFFFLVHTKLYLWSNTRRDQTKKEVEKKVAKASRVYIPSLSESKLHDLAWSLDIQERIAGGILTPEERREKHPTADTLAPVHTAQEARATREETIIQQIDKLARERSQGRVTV